MRKITAGYTQGEAIVLLFLPGLMVLYLIMAWIQHNIPLFTLNMVAVLDGGLIALLLFGLALIFRGIRNVSDERLRGTDWFLRILLVFLVIASLLAVISAIRTIINMHFAITVPAAYLRQYPGYGPMVYQLLNCVALTVGAILWLHGIHRQLPVRALCGAFLFVILSQAFFYEITHYMPGETPASIPHDAQMSSLIDDEPGENMAPTTAAHAGAHSLPAFPAGSDKSPAWSIPSLGTLQFYFVVLMLFTFIRFGRACPRTQPFSARGADTSSGCLQE